MPSSPTQRSQKRSRAGWPCANTGRVAKVGSVSEFEKAAHEPEAKGVLLERGPNPLEKQMVHWVCSEPPTPMHFACEHARVHFPTAEESDSPHKLPSDLQCDQHLQTTSATQNISNACARLVKTLPKEFQEVLREDAEQMAQVMHRLLPDVPWLRLAIEVVGDNVCWRWHQDNYVGRTIVTYAGPGTWVVDDKHVNWDLFFTPRSQINRIVPDIPSICMTQTNSVCLIKGKHWPGIPGCGLIHKAPEKYPDDPAPYTGKHRLVMKVELANKQIL